MPLPRRTVARTAEVIGAGLFTGHPARLRIHSTPPDSGIRFRRIDMRDPGEIPAVVAFLAPQPPGIPARNTTLGAHPAGVMTVEHILSVLAGLGITDALLEVDGPELPIGDGSAMAFVKAIGQAGITEHGETIEPITIDREITVEARDVSITARPRHAPGCRYTYELDFAGGPIPAQAATFDSAGPPDAYTLQIAPARTFCLQAEAEAMRAMGLFANLTPRDMLIFGDDGPIDNELRFENEPARHKLLDLIGDLALAGRPLQLEVTSRRAGHALNHELARRLAAAT